MPCYALADKQETALKARGSTGGSWSHGSQARAGFDCLRVIEVQAWLPALWVIPHVLFAQPLLRTYRWFLGHPLATVRKPLTA